MNKSLAIGLVIGLGVGLIGGAIIAKSKQPLDKEPVVVAPPNPPPPPPPPPPAPKEPTPDPELEKLRAENSELKAKLEAKAKAEAPRDDAKADFEKAIAAKSEWAEKLEALLKKGLGAYKGADFRAMVEELKKLGKEGIDKLADRLLHAESGGERFLAAALLEDVADPSAISALAQSLGKDDDQLVRRMSSHAIAMIKNEAGLPALRAAMAADTDWGVRVNSAYGVAVQKQEDGVKWLVDFYESESSPKESKGPVIGALASLGEPSTAPLFRKVLKEATEVSYQLVAISALEAMKDTASVAELNRIANTSTYSANVREAAKKAVDALTK